MSESATHDAIEAVARDSYGRLVAYIASRTGDIADSAAKRGVADRLCEWFGWKPGNIIDLGDITDARGTEMFLALWVRLWGVLGTSHFNIRDIREK